MKPFLLLLSVGRMDGPSLTNFRVRTRICAGVMWSNSSILVGVVVARPVSNICVDFETKSNKSQRQLDPWRCGLDTKYPRN